MNSDKISREELLHELRIAAERLWAEYGRVGPKWSAGNPTRPQVRINSALFAMVYVLFNSACLILGLVFVFFQGCCSGSGHLACCWQPVLIRGFRSAILVGRNAA